MTTPELAARIDRLRVSQRGSSGDRLEQQDFERIARTALRELGAGDVPITITPDGQSGTWHITIAGGQAPLKIRCGRGTTPQWIREQIFDQFNAR